MKLSAPLGESYHENYAETLDCHQNPEMITLNPVNKLMITSVTKNPASLPQPSKNLWRKQICVSGLYIDHRKFTITNEDSSHYQ